KKGSENDKEIKIYDSVGFAIEDFSALRLTLDLAEQYDLDSQMDIVPSIKETKNFFSVLLSIFIILLSSYRSISFLLFTIKL
ncbi:hypothetical protein IFN73_09980, partial [Francisella tularensis subsp. holarctica]|nr:hypothetical protein [Francisella tularensis subsp. holarctica]